MEINPNRILLTGGSGLLGTQFRKLAADLLAPDEHEFDILFPDRMRAYLDNCRPEMILHGAAFTSPPLVDKDPITAMDVNIVGTANMVRLASERNLRLVYISTDYVFKGDRGNYSEEDELYAQNRYAWSKLGGECAVRMYADSLIIRTTFSPPVFPFDKAFVDQYTSRDSVAVIAPLILQLARNSELTGVIHVGTGRKTVKDLAIQLGKTDVGDLKRSEVPFEVPYDTSFNLSKLRQVLPEEFE